MEFWSWLLAAIGLTGLWLAGSKQRHGLLLNVFALTTGQYGFVLTAIAYAVVYLRLWSESA